eukprot:TRINITY_DN1848_c0_g4_i6.p1 TRINITY_DN1848_c0_g4~~TRINITY_DN1848_c0_g4_i6.p1  ORF type:complete len:468 (-),score=71.89 TRINITY_DN1848_c0_g4_i6:661-2064(-)
MTQPPLKRMKLNPKETLISLFHRSCDLHPNKTSIQFPKNQTPNVTWLSFTYSELRTTIDNLSHNFDSLFIPTTVGLCLEASLEFVLSLLSLMSLQRVCVPLDLTALKTSPGLTENVQGLVRCIVLHSDRWEDKGTREFVLNTFRPDCKIVTIDNNLLLKVMYDPSPFVNSAPPDVDFTEDIAYILFTSGSTRSIPITVRVLHPCVVSNVKSFTQRLGLYNKDKMVLMTPVTFDPVMIDIFGPLAVGGTLVILNNSTKLIPFKFSSAIRQFGITCVQCTPSFLRQMDRKSLYESFFSNSSLVRFLVVGGEDFPSLREIRFWSGGGDDDEEYDHLSINSNLLLCNVYGITEVSVWASMYEISLNKLLKKKQRDYKLPVGRPFEDTKFMIRNSEDVVLEDKIFQNSDRQLFTGRLLIGSSIRRCLLDDEKFETIRESSVPWWRETGDLVQVTGTKIKPLRRQKDLLPGEN